MAAAWPQVHTGMHGELGNSYIIGVGRQYVSCLLHTGHPQEIVESALPKGVGKQLGDN